MAGQATTTTIPSKLKTETITLEGVFEGDVDTVLIGGGLAAVPTKNKVEIINLISATHLGSITLSANLLQGLDLVALKKSKIALIPTKDTLNNGYLDIIDTSALTKTSVKLASQPQIDVDIQVTPDEIYALIPTRQDATNSYLEIIKISDKKVYAKININGDLVPGVDLIISSDGTKGFMPTLKPTVGSNINFIDITTKKNTKVLGIDGELKEDVDIVLTSNDEMLLAPTTTSVRGFLSVIEAKTKTIQKRLELSGPLQTAVDFRLLPGERKGYIPVRKGNQGIVDFIDIYKKQLSQSVTLSGDLVEGIDGEHTPDGTLVLIPSQKVANAYLDIIDASTGTVKAKILLSGNLKAAVDVQISEDGLTAYMPSEKPGRAKIDVIDIKGGKIIKTLELSAGLVKDVDPLMSVSASLIAVPNMGKTGYITVIRNSPPKALTCPTNGKGNGYVDVVDMNANVIFGTMKLKGEIVAGVDSVTDGNAKTSADPDEDMAAISDFQMEEHTTTTTIQTTSTTSTTRISSTTTTITDTIPTTSTTSRIATTTTLEDMVITPRCGDGYLSWHGAPGGGSEECDPNTGPYNNWVGAQRFDCPPGLSCINCKCVGCGDGRLNQPEEECDRWSKKVKVNDVWLWEGDLIDCKSGFTCDFGACECVKNPVCGDGILDSGEQCEKDSDCDTGYECSENCNCIKVPYCGDGILDSGEQCEGEGSVNYHKCVNCQYVTDCNSFCSSVGNGYANTPGITTSSDCSDKNNPSSALSMALNGIKKTCRASCGSASFLNGISDTCCCIKTNFVEPCDHCPCTEGVDCHLMTCAPQAAACQTGL